MGALKMKSLVSDHQKLMTIESQHQSWSSCNTGEVAEELNVDHSVVVQHLKQIGKVKKLNKLVPHELTKKKKKIILLMCFTLCNNNKPLLNRIVTRNEEWILYDNQRQPAW